MDNETIVSTLAEHSNRIKVSEHRIEDLEAKTDKIESLTLSVHSLAQSVENLAKDQTEYRVEQKALATRILDVEQAPAKEKAKKHDESISWIVKCVLSALIGFLFAYFGFN